MCTAAAAATRTGVCGGVVYGELVPEEEEQQGDGDEHDATISATVVGDGSGVTERFPLVFYITYTLQVGTPYSTTLCQTLTIGTTSTNTILPICNSSAISI